MVHTEYLPRHMVAVVHEGTHRQQTKSLQWTEGSDSGLVLQHTGCAFEELLLSQGQMLCERLAVEGDSANRYQNIRESGFLGAEDTPTENEHGQNVGTHGEEYKFGMPSTEKQNIAIHGPGEGLKVGLRGAGERQNIGMGGGGGQQNVGMRGDEQNIGAGIHPSPVSFQIISGSPVISQLTSPNSAQISHTANTPFCMLTSNTSLIALLLCKFNFHN